MVSRRAVPGTLGGRCGLGDEGQAQRGSPEDFCTGYNPRWLMGNSVPFSGQHPSAGLLAQPDTFPRSPLRPGPKGAVLRGHPGPPQALH